MRILRQHVGCEVPRMRGSSSSNARTEEIGYSTPSSRYWPSTERSVLSICGGDNVVGVRVVVLGDSPVSELAERAAVLVKNTEHHNSDAQWFRAEVATLINEMAIRLESLEASAAKQWETIQSLQAQVTDQARTIRTMRFGPKGSQ